MDPTYKSFLTCIIIPVGFGLVGVFLIPRGHKGVTENFKKNRRENPLSLPRMLSFVPEVVRTHSGLSQTSKTNGGNQKPLKYNPSPRVRKYVTLRSYRQLDPPFERVIEHTTHGPPPRVSTRRPWLYPVPHLRLESSPTGRVNPSGRKSTDKKFLVNKTWSSFLWLFDKTRPLISRFLFLQHGTRIPRVRNRYLSIDLIAHVVPHLVRR